MRKFCTSVFTFIIMCLLINVVAFAASDDYRFTHNDHDTLIIGEIVEINDNTMVIKASDYIVSSSTMGHDSEKKQLTPQTASVDITGESWYGNGNRKAGDYVIASLNKNGDMFDIAWGVYSIDSLDYKTLKVTAYNPEISAEYTDFVNSGGLYTEYYFNNTTVTRHYEGVDTVIYNGQQSNSMSEILPKNQSLQESQNEELDISNESQNQPKDSVNYELLITGGLGSAIVLFGIILLIKMKK